MEKGSCKSQPLPQGDCILVGELDPPLLMRHLKDVDQTDREKG